MKFYDERPLKEFDFWSGDAIENVKTLRDWEWEKLEKKLEEEREYWNVYNIDALFSCEAGLDDVAQWLGYKSWKQRLECCMPKWAQLPEWATIEKEEG